MTKISKSASALIIVVLIVSFFLPCKNLAAAEETSSEKEKKPWLIETGFSTGFNKGRMKGDNEYQSMVFSVLFGFDLKPLLKKVHIGFPGKFQFNFAPFLNPIIAPENNVEFGFDLNYKYSFPLFEKLWPYIEVGNGFIYSTQETPEQSTQWNFLSQGGGGFSFFIKKDVSLNASYRYRHYSNAGAKEPNRGIDSSMYMVGISFHR
ncbi:MAG: acyloxyacyl hydrolase [Candidatus Omnitrophota bacterium]